MGGIVSDITDGLGLTDHSMVRPNSAATSAEFKESFDKSSAARDASNTQVTDAANNAEVVATGLGTNIANAAQANFQDQTAFNKPLLEAGSDAAQTELSQGKKNLETYDAEGRPLQKLIRDDALGIITPEKQQFMDMAAGTAIADARNGTTQQQNMIMRQGARYGFSADKFSSMGSDAAAVNAQSAVAAANSGRTQAGDRFTANVNNAYKTYTDLQTSGANLINSGTNTAATGAGIKQATAAQYIQGLNAGASVVQNGQAQKLNGLGSVLNSNTSAYGADASARSGVTNAVTNANASMFNTQTNANGEVMGAIIGAAATAASDIRLKRNIEKVSDDPRGFAWYSYDYVWGGPRQLGVMAHEVEKVIPDAVITKGGYKAVIYSML